MFFGARGPLSRDLLEKPETFPIGDPALLLPLIRRPEAESGKTLCVPHYHEPLPYTDLIKTCGADSILSPMVKSLQDVDNLVGAISASSFVLAGSLHAAIIAAAYNRPFAYWDTGHIDTPFKWSDFSASLGVEVKWVKDVTSGLKAYGEIADDIRLPALSPILSCCPFAVRPAITIAAASHDARVEQSSVSRLDRVIESTKFDFGEYLDIASSAINRDSELLSSAVTRAEKIEASLKRMNEVSRWLHAEMEAARFNFANGSRELVVSNRGPGSTFLGPGWENGDDIPWSIAQVAQVRLPESSGWGNGSSLCVSGYVFIPPRHLGNQIIEIYLNDISVYCEEFSSSEQCRSMYIDLRFNIPQILTERGGWLHIRFVFGNPQSVAACGSGNDTRTIAFCIERVSLLTDC